MMMMKPRGRKPHEEAAVKPQLRCEVGQKNYFPRSENVDKEVVEF